MKTIKTLFVILFFGTMFIACENDTVDEEIGIEVNDDIRGEDDEGYVKPE
ncbi:hypothetical protein [Aquimarina mytili]|uniref:Uncharacterized protein n=1 Tax=Aquimarina mytili TaxID=874423 RepID=A0A937D775_9FLAO|nr:hypothetical protein [Aquimarina mytili]MBL0682810.1 hypothetical protein [Aquimarina mytili]